MTTRQICQELIFLLTDSEEFSSDNATLTSQITRQCCETYRQKINMSAGEELQISENPQQNTNIWSMTTNFSNLFSHKHLNLSSLWELLITFTFYSMIWLFLGCFCQRSVWDSLSIMETSWFCPCCGHELHRQNQDIVEGKFNPIWMIQYQITYIQEQV